MAEQDYYTQKELARKLGCHVDTIYRAIWGSRIKPLKVGRVYRIPAQDIEKLKLA